MCKYLLSLLRRTGHWAPLLRSKFSDSDCPLQSSLMLLIDTAPPSAILPHSDSVSNAAARAFDADDSVGAIVLTGSDRAFAAGADIKEMSTKTFSETFGGDMFADWADLSKIRKPVGL